MMATSATCIGFRTYRLRPVTTRFRGGAMGAGVPRPCSAKRANESTIPGTPARIIIAPMPRVSSRPRNGGRSCQPVIHHGTSPASVNGATTKKTAEPRTAMVRCTAVPDTRCELIPTSPSWFPSVTEQLAVEDYQDFPSSDYSLKDTGSTVSNDAGTHLLLARADE